MDNMNKRLEKLETRMERNQRHTELVLTTQRESIDKGFEQVRLGFDQVRFALLEQEAAIRAQGVENRVGFTELTQIVQLIDERLTRLEDPPAA